MYDFIADLDEYFCEKYANYDKLCVLDGYRMPKMQTSEVRADGRTYAYTLPANTMRLALQENKAELLIALKKQMFDKTVSFSFRPLHFFARCKNKFSKFGFPKYFRAVLNKYNADEKQVGEELAIMPEIWKEICKGNFLPTKNLILSMSMAMHFSLDDTKNLLAVCGYELDYSIVKDVVISYLLTHKVYNADMIDTALSEYKVENLYLKREKTKENA